MATRSRRSAATETVEEEDPQETQGQLGKLKFKEPLVGRPGKQISVGDLLQRLKALCEELRGFEQDEADRDYLVPVAKELAHQSLLQHKDAGVRAWTACCVVDMFRLCAPDAPYTAQQLKEIFTLIIAKIMPLLADPSNPYNGQHLYVLRCLAEVKSIVLLTDIPGSTQLTSTLFNNCFDVLSGPSKADNGEELSKNVEHHMTAVLSILIDEAPSLSSDVVDKIVAQFLWADPITLGAGTAKGKKNGQVDLKQSTLLRKEAPPAYNMAKNLCNASRDKMARLIGTYFSSVIVEFSGSGNAAPKQKSKNRAGSDVDDSGDEGLKGPSEDELNDAAKAHRLLRELWRCAPGVLQDIIPHLQEELGTENIQLRQLATETFGDMISGIGAAGPPPRPELNPAAYPSQSLASPSENVRAYNFLTTPTSPNSFPSQYPGAYHAFLQRKHDKSPIIRASWITGVGRILMTSAGGVGLDPDEEQRLLKSFAECLIDSDERVRLAAVRAIEHFEFSDIVQKLGSNGSMSESGTILSNLADRVKDKKNVLHSESMQLLGKIWGVAAGAIAEGNEAIASLLGPIPSRILDACYVNDPEITAQTDIALYESLLPLGYPPMKPKPAVNGGSQIVKDSQTNGDKGYTEADLDKLRAERQLVLVKGLEEKAKKVFFAKQGNQAILTTYMEHFLKFCEEYNGGVVGKGEKDIKAKLEAVINYFGKNLPEPQRAIEDLWKFAKAHDRRSYQLIRFCMAPESDYRKIFKSIKELRKRIEEGPSGSNVLETLTPILYKISLLCYNKSHVPGIIEFSRSDDKGLAATAHEVLKEISTKHPKVFSTHVKELCKALESEAPTSKHPNPPGAVEDLKACAGFAKKFPKEVPLNTKDNRKLVQSFLNFALYGTPPKAAKHAITIIMSSDDKKQMHAKEILAKSIKGFEYGGDHFLTKLAALSQLVLLGPEECEDDIDAIVDIAVNHVLLKPHSTSPETQADWMQTPDDDLVARVWALKILVNRLRSIAAGSSISEAADPVYKLLNTLVKDSGEMSKKKTTPQGHKSLQRLLAANFLIKLSCNRRFDNMLTPTGYNELAIVLQDPTLEVRKGFATKLMKYLGQNRLPSRYYAILFLLAYEPDTSLRVSVVTWVRSRRGNFVARKETTLETIFARLLSLLAHHPDFDNDHDTLLMMAKYILMYLSCVATQDNLSLIYHVAQRVKGVADGITRSKEADERLYILSDLSQAIIRLWEEQNGWSMQSWPGKLKLPAGIFRALDSHNSAQGIAEKVWVSDEVLEDLEGVVRSALKSKKRKAPGHQEKEKKRAKTERGPKKEKAKAERAIKTPKKKRRRGADSDGEDEGGEVANVPSSGPRRKSDRRSNAKSYVEVSSEDEAGARGEANADEVDEDLAEASEKETSPPEEDVEMAEPEEEPEVEAVSEPEPDPEPLPERPKKATKAKGNKKAEAVVTSPKPAKATKGKLNGNTSSPAVNGSVRRSGRSRG
ncbi:armadillo-type protein [Clohesyomyces aquaticus]|uniref:Armadillo-type protein n=1 Tax=Clohesyomyces aquaticus TaxID=1231657 RepID=A0A1Y1ZY04_9PLEO|nr:armadillo-type protein [Clohesyomyces aquaticus]